MTSKRVPILSILLLVICNNQLRSTFSFFVNNHNLKWSNTEYRRHLINRQKQIQILSTITDNDILTTPSTTNEDDGDTSLIGIKSLGVDYGTLRTGVAVTIGYAPIPLTIINSLNRTSDLAMDIVKLAQSEKATQIVIGLPLHKNGTISEQANIVQNFAEIVACTVYKLLGPNSKNIYLFDERYSSKEAMARILSTAPGKDQKKQFIIDAESACIILEHFYATDGVGKQLVTVPDHLRQECNEIWLQQDKLNKENQQKMVDERMNALDARKEMIKKVQMETGTSSTSRKKKKKKKKKKKSANWIVL